MTTIKIKWCVHCQDLRPHGSSDCDGDNTAPIATPLTSVRRSYLHNNTERYYDSVKAKPARRGRPPKAKPIIYETWADQWNCAMCRSAKAFCRLHTSLNNDGVTPPKSWEGLI